MAQRGVKELASDLRVTDYLSYRDYLGDLYNELKKGDGGYSYARFAEDLGFSATNVIWLVITGRRKLTKTTAARIVTALGLKNHERRFFLALVRHNNARSHDERERIFAEMVEIKRQGLASDASRNILEYYSEWYHPVLREMTALPDFSLDPAWVNGRMFEPLLPRQIERSFELLQSLGLVKRDGDRYVHSGNQVRMTDDVSAVAGTRYHQKMLEMAKQSLTRTPAKERDYNALTVCVSRDVAMKIRDLMHALCRQIMDMEAQSDETGEIYQANVMLFPLTKKRAQK